MLISIHHLISTQAAVRARAQKEAGGGTGDGVAAGADEAEAGPGAVEAEAGPNKLAQQADGNNTLAGNGRIRRFDICMYGLSLGGERRVFAVHFGHCVCVFFPSILDIKFVGRTSRGHTGRRSHRIFNPPSFCGACLDFCREKDSAIPFPRRP